MKSAFSVIVPCYNEQNAIESTVEQIVSQLAGLEYELIVVNDGSTDATAESLKAARDRCRQLRIVHHEANRGYGAALKTGIRHAGNELIAITDADGTYPNDRIPELIDRANEADMVVGSRTAEDVEYSKVRKLPKIFLSAYVSWICRRSVPDMNSGLRVFRRSLAERFLTILPDGFSFTTTITIAMITNGYRVDFIPIGYKRRIGKSKIQPIRDTIRFFNLILRTGIYFAPLRVFLPLGVLTFLGFTASLGYDVFVLRNLTDKTVVLLATSLNVIMFALLADMIDKRL